MIIHHMIDGFVWPSINFIIIEVNFTMKEKISVLGKARRHIYVQVVATGVVRRFTRGQLSHHLSNESYVIEDFMTDTF